MPEPEQREGFVASPIDDGAVAPDSPSPVGDDTGPVEVDVQLPESALAQGTEESAPGEVSTIRQRVTAAQEALFDPDRRWLGYLRAGLTVVVLLVMVWVLVSTLGALFDAVGEVLDSFQRTGEETIESLASRPAA